MKKQLKADVVLVNGCTTYYWQRNAKANSHVVLVLHGFMSDYRSMERFVEYLNIKTDTRILLPDLPGFGASTMPNNDPSVDDYVDWAVQFLQAVAPDAKSVTIIGYSFGSYIAITLAGRRLIPLKKLILVTPVIKIGVKVRIYTDSFNSLATVSMEAAKKLYTWQPSFDFTTYYLSKTKDKERKEKLKVHRRSELESLRPELVLNLYKTLSGIDLLAYADTIEAPVVVIVAKKDNLASNYYTHLFISRLNAPCCRSIVRHAGHLLPFEEPELLARIIDSYGL